MNNTGKIRLSNKWRGPIFGSCCRAIKAWNGIREGKTASLEDGDDAHDGNTARVARGTVKAARSREGTHAAQRRAGASAAGAAMGADREGIPVRHRRRQRLAEGPVPRALAAAGLLFHVRT